MRTTTECGVAPHATKKEGRRSQGGAGVNIETVRGLLGKETSRRKVGAVPPGSRTRIPQGGWSTWSSCDVMGEGSQPPNTWGAPETTCFGGEGGGKGGGGNENESAGSHQPPTHCFRLKATPERRNLTGICADVRAE